MFKSVYSGRAHRNRHDPGFQILGWMGDVQSRNEVNATTGLETSSPSAHSADPSSRAEPAVDRVSQERAAVQAVLASTTFAKRPRLANLLRYICDRYFEGETDTVKEFSIATDVFRRPQSFDQATDSIVRVEVFRLRKKLREFYEGEGADQPIEILIVTGHYRPEFADRLPTLPRRDTLHHPPDAVKPTESDRPTSAKEPAWIPEATRHGHPDPVRSEAPASAPVGIREFGHRTVPVLGIALALIGLAALALWSFRRSHNATATTNTAPSASPSPDSLLSAGPEIRIRCGYSRSIFKDEEGNVWMGDRYFSGGFANDLRDQSIARTRDRELYLTGRTGVFSYKIPLPPGSYELRLHFAETTYSPSSSLGGGENSRVFDVRLNGQPLLTQFDIVSDAGASTADVRVFQDVRAAQDGYLHLDFTGVIGAPILNAIEIVPGLQYSLRPIRMVAQNSFFVDKAGNLWMPDTYFSSGQLAADKVVIGGTAEAGLYAGERYGNFTYAFPVGEGTYRVTLYFSEKYWGTEISKETGVGRRIFDIFCNGVALTRRLDIVKEAGPARALMKTYHDLQPNAQGKLILSFVPDVNYATVNAIEVQQEAK